MGIDPAVVAGIQTEGGRMYVLFLGTTDLETFVVLSPNTVFDGSAQVYIGPKLSGTPPQAACTQAASPPRHEPDTDTWTFDGEVPAPTDPTPYSYKIQEKSRVVVTQIG